MDNRQNGRWIAAHDGWLAISWTFRGRRRTFAPARWTCLAVVIGLPLLGAWYLAATLYLVFHDPMLASVISRQSDMQYAYEDRIAELRTELDRETSRGLMDRRTLETSIHDLSERSAQLEARAAILDRLVARNAKLAGKTGSVGSNDQGLSSDGGPLPLPANGRLRLGSDPNANEPIDNPLPGRNQRSELTVPQSEADLTQRLASIEDRQARALVALRDPALHSVARMHEALTDAGLGAKLAKASLKLVDGDVGGPFVPLPADALSNNFEQNAALVDDALSQQERLAVLVAKVPLRKPILGPLEVTSPFGARLDPFLGRPAMHTGIDFRESYGDDVHATAAGVVTVAGSEGGYGTMIEIDHGNGLATRYAHLSSVNVSINQKVAAGDVIGHAGSSGRATGPHLHYETRINGEPVDPVRFLKAGARLSEN